MPNILYKYIRLNKQGKGFRYEAVWYGLLQM